MEDKILKPDLRVPEQKTASLSFCDTSPKALRSWVSQLPMANIGEVSRQLYHAIIELNHLFAAPQQRLQYLELIREKIHFVCNELSRHFLGLAVALPEKQRKIANLSQALQLHLASGYKLCVLEFLDNGGLDKHRKLLTLAIHRAISELSATILRSHQLYCPSPPLSWLECHRLFRFAHRHKLVDFQVEDDSLEHRRTSSIADSYKRVLLLGCSQVYELFETWASHARCGPDTGDDSLFVVNLEKDTPPIYRSLLETGPGNDSFGFDTRDLSAMVSEVLTFRREHQQAETPLKVPAKVSDTLLTHLSQALGILAKRNFNRIASQGKLEVCVGLTAAHYFIAGEKTFTEFVHGNDTAQLDDENPFIRAARKKQDAWSGAHDAAPSEDRLYSADTPINFRGSHGTAPSDLADRNRPRSYQALLINTSPGGYCVGWENHVPPSLQAGELLGVREQSSHPWSVAVVRWIRQVKHQGTPRLPFQTGSRISLLHDGRDDQGTLGRKVSATGSISQFELKLHTNGALKNGGKPTASGASEDEFDSLWPSL
jgi:hypothetical protein